VTVGASPDGAARPAGASEILPGMPRRLGVEIPGSWLAPAGDTPSTAERVLTTAAVLFREKGYAQTTTRELARHVGIAGPSLYHHFKTKEDILFSLCVESLRRLAESVTAIEPSDDAVRQLREMITAHVVTVLRDKNMHATMLVEMRALSPERQQQVIEGRDAYERVITRVIEQGQRDGVLRSDVSARQMTLALLNMLNWTIFWFQDDGRLTLNQLAEVFADLYVDGARCLTIAPGSGAF
jgi:AcrR family transcriptional regulator